MSWCPLPKIFMDQDPRRRHLEQEMAQRDCSALVGGMILLNTTLQAIPGYCATPLPVPIGKHSPNGAFLQRRLDFAVGTHTSPWSAVWSPSDSLSCGCSFQVQPFNRAEVGQFRVIRLIDNPRTGFSIHQIFLSGDFCGGCS